MKAKKINLILLTAALLTTTLFSTSCDESFYLSEREFYALQTQIARQDYANMFFGDVQGEMLRITFDNSTSPPRVQSSNLLEFMRTHLTTFALLEGFPFYYFQGDRVSGEFEKQFDNWLADRLSLYAGANNAEARLTRVDELRVQFLNNPTFTHSPNKISFDTTLRIGVDCTIEVNALDSLTNLIFSANGTHNVLIDIQTLRVQGDFYFDEAENKESKWHFRLTPQVGVVAVGERGAAVPNVIKTGIVKVVKQNFAFPIDESFNQKYEHFTLNDCRVSGQNNNFTCDYNSRPSFPNPELHAVARGSDNRLYAAIRRNDVWSSYNEVICCATGSPVQAIFSGDPSLAVSSARTVELAATTTGGAIFYAQLNSFWGKQQLIAPVIPPNTLPNAVQNYSYRGKPAIVASAPGQVEIITARGSASGSKALVHLRRINGVWTAPISLSFPSSVGTFPNITFVSYGEPVAVQSGNKIFLAVAASNSRIYAMVFDMETGVWSQHSQIPTAENVSFTPALAASGDGRVNLVYIGQSGAIYHRPLDVNSANIMPGVGTTGFGLFSETSIPGSVNAAPVLFANGYRQLGLVARGTDNRLYYNHFVGTHSTGGWVDGRTVGQGWQGWGDLNGNFIGTQILSNGQMDEFAATTTKTGKIDVAARIRQNAAENSTLHHNSFDAARYGTKPWKTVHWRGYQKVTNRLFVGRPAIAALDANLEVAYVGKNSNIFQAQIGASFIQRTSFQVFSNAQNVPAPIVTTSGKGLTDIIAVGSDQKIRHIRQFNRAAFAPALLPGQANLNFQRRPSVAGYGEGQIDVIGVSTAGTIYHWRYLNGNWQTPRLISGTVSSPPILVATGGGQLEFFALGGDNKLYRWRFTGGAWGNWQQIPSTFTMNPNYFGHGSATSWGDGTVDLAVVRIVSGTPVYHRRFEPRDDTIALPNQPAQTFQNIGSGAGDQPFIAAAASNLRIVMVKDAVSSEIREFAFGAGSWRTQIFNNPLGVRPSGFLIDSGGYKLLATDLNGKTYLSRSWFELLPVPEQNQATLLRLPLFRPAFASHGGQ